MTKLVPNKVRQKLKDGNIVWGTAIYSASPNIVESVGHAGIDFVRLDTEHNWRQDDSLDNMIRAATISGTVPIVRIDRDNPYLIRKALEVGAGGIIVPHCYTAAYAREVVDAAKFPPLGSRGFGNLCASGAWGTIPSAEWIDYSNSEPLIGVMIEHIDAMKEIDEILMVKGIDFVLFGPADLSISLGLKSPQLDHPQVFDALKKTLAAAKAANKHVMLGVGYDNENIKKYRDMGVTMVEVGHDVHIVPTFINNIIKNANN